MKKQLSAFLTFVLMCTVIFTGSLAAATAEAEAATFTDITDHWAKEYILKAADAKIISGYPDGTFLPDKSVSRAEFTKMVNNAFGNELSTDTKYKDVPTEEWFYTDVNKAVAAGYAGGYDDGTFRPNGSITRQEAAVMLARLVPTAGYSANLKAFNDYSDLADWAESSMSRIVGKKYMGAYDDGGLHPQDTLTRAQAAKILYDITTKEKIVKTSQTFRTVDVSATGISTSGIIYSNGIVVGSEIEDYYFHMYDCVVLGNVYVQGGGAKSDCVLFEDSRLTAINVSKQTPVRIIAKGDTRILNAYVWNAAELDTQSLGGALFGTGYDNILAYSGSNLTLDGNYKNVKIFGKDCKLNFTAGTMNTLDIDAVSSGTAVSLGTYAKATTVNADAKCTITGMGEIGTLNVKADGVTYETKPGTVNVGQGINNPTYTGSTNGVTLKSLSAVSMTSITPAFSPSTYAYTVVMPAGSTSVSIQAVPTKTGAIVAYSLDGTNWSTSVTSFALTSGMKTTVYINVNEIGKGDSTYTVTVTLP